MNPVSSSLSVLAPILLMLALVAGIAIGLRIARARTRALVDSALAQAGNAAQVELAQLRERVRATEQDATALRAELDRARHAAESRRDELDAARDERARLEERASRVATLEAYAASLADKLRLAGDELLRVSTSEAQKHQHVASLQGRIEELEREATEAAAQGRAKDAALQAAHDGLAELRESSGRRISQLTEELRGERENAVEKLRVLQDAKVALSDQFKSLASDILEEKSKRFAEQNQQSLGTLLDPLRTQLSEFKGKVEEVYVQEGKDRSALSEQVRQLMEMNQTLSRDANNLTKALKGSAKTQGNWGELILERVLEASGLRKGHEYHVQDSQRDDEGRLLQPDVVIDLPEQRKIVVDAKVSLVAYDRFTAAESEEDRLAATRLHLDSVRNHVKGLSGKKYQELYGLKSLDFVLMFIPIEPAFMLAVTNDDALFMDAWQRNVLLVSPSTLLFVVRTVAHLWRQEAQSRNAQEIAKRGAELYDKLAGFVADLQRVGDRLGDARKAYDDAHSKLATGKGNAIRQAEMLRALGVKPTKALPGPLVEAALEREPLLAAPGQAALLPSLFDAVDAEPAAIEDAARPPAA